MRLRVDRTDLARSVLAVPPFALDENGEGHAEQNRKLIDHIETGGVSTLLYGGNALVYHWPMARFASWLDQILAATRDATWVIPSVGADGGRLIDQAPVIRARRFPVVMMLPVAGPYTQEGLVAALTRFADASGAQALLYIKSESYVGVETLAALDEAGALFGVKYAVPRAPGAEDPFLREILALIGPERVVSGFGEPPAVHHLSAFGLAGFTAGCVCIAPALSMAVLGALKSGDVDAARRIMEPILPLEALRNEINEIRVLHDAISLCGLAEMGSILAPSSPIPGARREEVAEAARALLAAEHAFRAASAA